MIESDQTATHAVLSGDEADALRGIADSLLATPGDLSEQAEEICAIVRNAEQRAATIR